MERLYKDRRITAAPVASSRSTLQLSTRRGKIGNESLTAKYRPGSGIPPIDQARAQHDSNRADPRNTWYTKRECIFPILYYTSRSPCTFTVRGSLIDPHVPMIQTIDEAERKIDFDLRTRHRCYARMHAVACIM